MFAYNVSKNKVASARRSRGIDISRRQRIVQTPVANSVISWLLTEAKYYQLNPDVEQVIVPFRRYRDVHEVYMDAVRKQADTEVKLLPCSVGYFIKVWTSSKLTKHITVRKYLRFSKCDICVKNRSKVPPWESVYYALRMLRFPILIIDILYYLYYILYYTILYCTILSLYYSKV